MEARSSKDLVFLGGSCDLTTWRKDTAIPALEAAGTAYFNPQVDEWSADLVAVEAAAKDAARWLLFVIDGQTRAVASMIEAAALIGAGRDVLLVTEDLPAGTVIDGEEVAGRQLRDLNRARAYLRDIALRHGTRTYASVQAAVRDLARLAG